MMLVKTSAFGYDESMKFRGKGVSGTATKNTTTNIDYKLTEERYLSGVRLILDKHVLGDKADLQVVDVDNLLGLGAGAVLDTFAEDWYFGPGVCIQPDAIRNYPAKIPAGFYIRIAYTSVGTVDDVKMYANFFLDKKVT